MAVAYRLLILAGSLITLSAGQQLKDVVTSHVKDAITNTKIQLGYKVPVKGQSVYETSSSGKSITFVLSGTDFGFVDPFVQVSYTSQPNDVKQVLGNTESGRKTPNPDWTQGFGIMWKSGTSQKLKFRVLDHSAEDNLIGEGTLDVDEFVAKGDVGEVKVVLEGSNLTEISSGQLIVKRTIPLKFKLAASNIMKSDEFGGRSDPYVKVYFRNGENGEDTKFYTTATIDNVENARWDDVVEFTQYRPKTDQYLHFKVRDADSVTKDDHLGEVLVPADSIYEDSRGEQTVYLENSGEHSSLTIMRI